MFVETCFASVRTQDASAASFIDASDTGYRLLIRLFFRRRELFIHRFRRRCWCDIFIFKRPPKPRLVRASGLLWLLCGRRGWVDELTSLRRERFSECQPSGKTKKRILRRRALSLFLSPASQVGWTSLFEEEDTPSSVASFRSMGAAAAACLLARTACWTLCWCHGEELRRRTRSRPGNA